MLFRSDLVWVFDLQASGDWSFTQIPELVMPDDSDELIGAGDRAASVDRLG